HNHLDHSQSALPVGPGLAGVLLAGTGGQRVDPVVAVGVREAAHVAALMLALDLSPTQALHDPLHPSGRVCALLALRGPEERIDVIHVHTSDVAFECTSEDLLPWIDQRTLLLDLG